MRPIIRRLLIAAAARYGTAPLLYGVRAPFSAQVISLASLLSQHPDLIEHRVLVDDAQGFLPGAVRVHPEDDPQDPGARRWIRDDSGDYSAWMPLTGWGGAAPYPETELSDAQIKDYPVQAPAEWLRLLGHKVTSHG